ncbi:MAG: aromatic ring-hydroxylating dioxygenase subunit alpha [Sphingomonadales bacterium]|nr:aromatic ring-hydroxylating dioxygenase subunit alpha [Sphingomonadales bacterium]
MNSVREGVYDRLVTHIQNGTTDQAEAVLNVPVSNFTSPEHLQRELEVFRHQPLIVAMSSELAEPGSFVTRDILGAPLLIVRQKSGKVAVFRNMCRHRGGKVELDEKGRKPFFVCSYHGWSFDGDGALRGVPFEDHLGEVDRGCKSLFRIQSEERHGMVWADFSGQEGRSVADFLGAADGKLAAYDVDQTTIYMEKHIDAAMNWKLVVDGAIDVLHPQFLHPRGVGKLIETNASLWEDFGRHGRSWSAYKKLSDKVRAGTHTPEDGRYCSGNFVIFPNVCMIPTPTHYEFWNVWPDLKDPGKCHVHIRFLIDPELLDEKRAGQIDKSWAILQQAATEEDFPMEETIQANANAYPVGDFLYGRSEAPCQHLHRQLARAMAEVAA